jgi:hypothetical protein
MKIVRGIFFYISSGSVIALYIGFMFIEPLFYNGLEGLIKALKDWQTLNAALIALFASFIALYTTQYNDKKKKERDFTASKAFLPEALSELTNYLELSAKLLLEAYRRENEENDKCTSELNQELPKLPNSHRTIFRDCIHSGEPEIGDYLSEILVTLQVHNSRMKCVKDGFKSPREFMKSPEVFMSNIFVLGKLHARVTGLFDFGRNQKDLNYLPLTVSQIHNSYKNLGLDVLEVDGLLELTERFCKNKMKRT